MFLNRIINTTNALVNGRKGISPSVNRFLAIHGDEPITQIMISRNVINSALIGTINVLSPNFKNKNQDNKLYHLKLLIKTTGSMISLEKNAGIEISSYKMENGAENLSVTVIPGLTLNILLDRTKQLMGNNFLTYSAKNNNCGNFVLAILKSNRLANSQNTLFVEQIIDHLFTDNLRKITNTVTGIAGKMDILYQGGKVE